MTNDSSLGTLITSRLATAHLHERKPLRFSSLLAELIHQLPLHDPFDVAFTDQFVYLLLFTITVACRAKQARHIRSQEQYDNVTRMRRPGTYDFGRFE